MGKRVFDRWEGDELFPVELDRNELLGSTGDLDADAGNVAASIGLVAELIGDTARRYGVYDAAYRQWRGAKYLEFKLVDGKAPSDELVKAQVEGDEEFLSRKAFLAELEGDLEYLRGLHEGLRTKAMMINARINLRRGKEHGESGGVDLRERSSALAKTDAERAAVVKAKMIAAKKEKT